MKKCLLFILTICILTACHTPRDIKKEGGMRYILEMDPAQYSKEAKQQCLQALMKRINGLQLEDVTITDGEKPGLIVIDVPGNQDLSRMKKVLQQSAKLAFYETYDNREIYPGLENLDKQLADSLNKNPLFALLYPAVLPDERGESTLREGPVVGSAMQSDTATVNALLNAEAVKKNFHSGTRFLWTLRPERGTNTFSLIAIHTDSKGGPVLSGDILKDVRKEADNQSGRLQITLNMNEGAAVLWKRITKANIGKSIAIVIDGRVMCYPVVQSEISGGLCVISSDFSNEEADDLVNMLKAGDMPVALKIVSEQVVKPVK